jgi:sulfate transport system ATP-binding protein
MEGVPARQRGMGMVFQQYAIFGHMTVARNVAFGLQVRPRATRPSRQQIRARVADLLDLMSIGDLADRYPNQISGGQRQRVALARALAIDPSVLLLDEPFGALDAQVRKGLRIWLRALHDRVGLTSLFVTHDQTEAMEMADRVAVLRRGRIEQIGTPDELYHSPASAFVHAFLGESIRLDCLVASNVARLRALPEVAWPAHIPDGPGFALVRPHEMRLLPSPGPARIISIHISGPMLRVEIELAGQSMEILTPPDAISLTPGQSHAVDLTAARVYPAE